MTVLLGLRLQDRKDQILFAHIGGAFNIEGLANQRQIADLFLLERFQIQTIVFYDFLNPSSTVSGSADRVLPRTIHYASPFISPRGAIPIGGKICAD